MAWNGSDNGKAKVEGQGKAKAKGQDNSSLITPRSSLKRAALAGTLVVLGGALALYMVLGRTPAPESAAPQKAPPKKSVPAKLVLPPTNVVEKVEEVKSTNSSVRMEHGVAVVREQVTTNKNGAVIERLWLADGTTKRKIHPPKPVFEHPSDQLIAMALSAKPGQSMPPLPGLDNVDDDFAKSLLSPIRIEETDSDEVKDMKAKVMEARAYLAEEVKNGGTVQEALRQYQVDMEKYADSHLMAVQQIQEIRKTDGEEAAKEFRDRVNESFRARGIPELETPERDTDTQKQEEE